MPPEAAASGFVTGLGCAAEACADCVTRLAGGFAPGFGEGTAEVASSEELGSAGAGLGAFTDFASAGFAAAEFASAGFAGVARSRAGKTGFVAAASDGAEIGFEATGLADESELLCQT